MDQTPRVTTPFEPQYVSTPLPEKKAKICSIISFLFFLIALFYLLSMATFLSIIIILDHILGADELVFSFLQNYPTVGIIPLLFSLIAWWFMYLSLQIKQASRLSLWLGIISVVIIPYPAALIAKWSAQLFITTGLSATNNLPFASMSQIKYIEPIYILAVLIFVLLVLSLKKFHLPDVEFSKKAKIVMLFLCSVSLRLSIA